MSEEESFEERARSRAFFGSFNGSGVNPFIKMQERDYGDEIDKEEDIEDEDDNDPFGIYFQ